MNLKPLHDRVLVQRVEEEEKTKGGIIIPETAKEKPIRGKVKAVGPGKMTDEGKRIEMSVQAGNLIMFNKYAGTEVKIEDEEHLVMREDDILAVIED
ncbi:MAG: co-chaperone GroES [Desulfohalobiaceae bacterium]